MSLRLLAFWLSWVRFHVVQEFGAMILSKRLLDTLEAWGGDNASEQARTLPTLNRALTP